MSWFQLLDIRRQAQQEFESYATLPPTSCPECGEPLKSGPVSSQDTLFCSFEGWAYPRDWVRPHRSTG